MSRTRRHRFIGHPALSRLPWPGLAALLAFVLVAAQALGLAHRISHGGPALGSVTQVLAASAEHRDAHVHEHGHAHAHAHTHAHAHADSASALFDDHDPGSAECRLLDQAAQADGLLAQALPGLPPQESTPEPTAAPAPRGRGGVRAYLARGPPVRARKGPLIA